MLNGFKFILNIYIYIYIYIKQDLWVSIYVFCSSLVKNRKSKNPVMRLFLPAVQMGKKLSFACQLPSLVSLASAWGHKFISESAKGVIWKIAYWKVYLISLKFYCIIEEPYKYLKRMESKYILLFRVSNFREGWMKINTFSCMVISNEK